MTKLSVNKKQDVPFISERELLDYAGIIVSKYVKSGTIHHKDRDDVIMGIVERFLKKQKVIEKGYSGKAKKSTYCFAVLNKMCCEEIRKELKHWKQSLEETVEVGNTSSLSASEKLLIKDEAAFLHKILLMFDDEYSKLKLFMAYFYQLLVKTSDIEAYDEHFKEHQLNEIFKKNNLTNKGEIFENLCTVVNRAENKSIKADSVRMWLNKTRDTIINRLNGPYNRAKYTAETLQTLFEYYYLDN